MKLQLLPFLILLSFTSCITVSPLIRNEQYIKNNIQQFGDGADSIQIIDMLTGSVKLTPHSDIDIYEITGYNYHNQKGIIIGIGLKKIVNITNNVVLYNYATEHINLNKEDCLKILSENQKLKDIINKKKINYREQFSADIKINQNLIMSFEGKNGSNQAYYISLWVNGKKMLIQADYFIQSLQQFLLN